MPIPFPRLALASPSIDRSTYFVRKLVPNAKTNDPEIPMVAVATGFAPSGGLEFAKVAGLSAGDAKGLVAQATKNSSEGGREWKVSETAGFIFKKPSLLRAHGAFDVPVSTMQTEGGGLDDLSSDLLLDEPFMAKACEMLGSADLIATVPKRGWLMVGKCQPGQIPVMMKFAQIAEGISGRGGKDALATACFFVQGGKLHGVSGKGASYVSLITSSDNPWNVN